MNNKFKEYFVVTMFLLTYIFTLNYLVYSNITFIVKESTAIVSIEKYLTAQDKYESCVVASNKEKCSIPEKRMLDARNIMDIMLQRLYE